MNGVHICAAVSCVAEHLLGIGVCAVPILVIDPALSRDELLRQIQLGACPFNRFLGALDLIPVCTGASLVTVGRVKAGAQAEDGAVGIVHQGAFQIAHVKALGVGAALFGTKAADARDATAGNGQQRRQLVRHIENGISEGIIAPGALVIGVLIVGGIIRPDVVTGLFVAEVVPLGLVVQIFALGVVDLTELAALRHLSPLGDEGPVTSLLGELILTAGLADGVDQRVALIDGVCRRNLGHDVNAALHLADSVVHLNVGVNRDQNSIIAGALGELLVGLEGLGGVADRILNISRSTLRQIVCDVADCDDLYARMHRISACQTGAARTVAQYCQTNFLVFHKIIPPRVDF